MVLLQQRLHGVMHYSHYLAYDTRIHVYSQCVISACCWSAATVTYAYWSFCIPF